MTKEKVTAEKLKKLYIKLLYVKDFVKIESEKKNDPILQHIYGLLDSIIKQSIE